MNFALDWDGTVTADSCLWEQFIISARARGHCVHIVTMRYENEPINKSFAALVDSVVYTGRKAKRAFVDSLGIIIHVWIDDNPVFIFEDASL